MRMNSFRILSIGITILFLVLAGCTNVSASTLTYESTLYSGPGIDEIIDSYGIDYSDPFSGGITKKCLEFNAGNFDGFYSDQEADISTESIRILGVQYPSSNRRKIGIEDLEYTTIIHLMDFAGNFDSYPHEPYDRYPVLGFFGEQYIPLRINDPTILAKLVVDSNEVITITHGNSINLGDGFTLKLEEIMPSNDRVRLGLYRNNRFLDDEVVFANSPYESSTWWYDRDVASEDDVAVFGVNVQSMTSSSVTIDALWLIDYEDILEITLGDKFDNLEVIAYTESQIYMRNPHELYLAEGSLAHIADEFYFDIEDTSTLAFKLISDKYLAIKHLPTLWFSEDEEYYPITVEEFLGESRLQVYGYSEGLNIYYGWYTLIENINDVALEPYTDDRSLYKLDLKKDVSRYKTKKNPSVCINIEELEYYDENEKITKNVIGLQYWWLSYYNPAVINSANHEGDWEHITVYVNQNTNEIDYVVFSQHYDVTCYNQRQVGIVRNHPAVFVAKGSHASYPRAGSTRYSFSNNNFYIDSHWGDGYIMLYREFQDNINFFDDLETTHSWPDLDGRWGDTDPGYIYGRYFDGSPKTPSVQERFNLMSELTSAGVILESPAYLYAIDEYGRRVGYNESNGKIDMQIPGAYYSGPDEHPQILSVDDLSLDVSFYMVPKDGGGKCNISTTVNNFQEKSSARFENVYIDENTIVSLNSEGMGSLSIDTNKDGEIDQILNSPSAIFHVNRTEVNTGEAIFFDADSNSLNNNVLYHWDFGDNSIADTEDVVHIYSTSGAFYATLTVTNEDGVKATYSMCINVIGPEIISTPVAEFSANVTYGIVPLTVQFNDKSQNATYWEWNFGDGTTSYEKEPIHLYESDGTFTVSLKVLNGLGSDEAIYHEYIMVNPVNSEPITVDPPTNEVPEFPTIAIPILIIIGMVGLFTRRKE